MNRLSYILRSFLNAIGVLAYVYGIAFLLSHAKYIFGDDDTQHKILIPIFMLILLIISATVAGLLVLGKPIYLYFNDQKKEAIFMLFATLGCLVLILFGVVTTVLLTK